MSEINRPFKRFIDFAPGPSTAKWSAGVWEAREACIKQLEAEVATLTAALKLIRELWLPPKSS